jgi:hypothetical protein
MVRENGDITSRSTPPGASGERTAQPYQPPMVEWEEEFAPVAASVCAPGDLCPDSPGLPPSNT